MLHSTFARGGEKEKKGAARVDMADAWVKGAMGERKPRGRGEKMRTREREREKAKGGREESP